MESKEIVNIGIEYIYPHPENPRKKLGNLEELAESIKKNGIMQNLTVIPGHWLSDDEWILLAKKYQESPSEELRQQINSRWSSEGYTTIIGHRRHAAATLAGIKTLPCRIVTDMSKKVQISTMLEENMQRGDLTIYEQAQGFQMMLDLGETESTIAEKTGFSKATVRHRLNIAKLDQKELQRKEQNDDFQLTLKNLYELEKVEDINTRNKILKEAKNSRELIWKAQNAASEAERAKKIKQLSDMLKNLGMEQAPKKAENEQYSGKWEVVKEFDLDKAIPKQIRLKEKDKMYYLVYYRSLRVIKRAKKEKKADTPEAIKRKQKERDKKTIKARLKEMDATRKEFIQNIITGKIDAIKNENEVQEKLWKVLFEAQSGLYPSSMRRFYTGKADYDCTPEEKMEAQKQVDSLSFTSSMLVMMHYAIENIGDIYDWQGYYNSERGNALLHAYEILKIYGWTFANDDDEQLLNGTHPLFEKQDEDQEV